MKNQQQTLQAIELWLDQVVIGLNLCPFAAKPRKQKQIKIQLSNAKSEEDLLHDLQLELNHLLNVDSSATDTTLLVITDYLQDFFDYNQFLDLAEALIHQSDLDGVFQIASFHPNYQFANTEPQDRENLTNRAPYPVLHIIREDSMELALNSYPNPDKIPTRNIQKMESLSEQQLLTLFPFIKSV